MKLLNMLNMNDLENNKMMNVSFPFPGLLTIAFVVLKLCKVITWSWWWVLCPMWIPIAILIIIAIIYIILLAIR
mgnify:CR=1 FL=1